MALTQYNTFDPQLDPVSGTQAQEPRVFAHDAVAIVVGAINDSDANHGLDITSFGTGYLIDDTITLTAPGGGGTTAILTITRTDEIDVNLNSNIGKSLLGAMTTRFNGATALSYTDLEPGVSTGVSTSGAGTGLKLSMTVGAGGIATSIIVTAQGTGYTDTDTITFTSGEFGGIANMVLTLGTGAVADFTVSTPGSTYNLAQTANQAGTTSARGTGFNSTVSNIDIPHTQKRGCCIYIGATGGLASLSVVMESGNTAVFTNISEGTLLPILIKRVTTALTANQVIALY